MNARTRRRHPRQRPLDRAMLDLRTAAWLLKQLWRAVRSDIRRSVVKARSS